MDKGGIQYLGGCDGDMRMVLVQHKKEQPVTRRKPQKRRKEPQKREEKSLKREENLIRTL